MDGFRGLMSKAKTVVELTCSDSAVSLVQIDDEVFNVRAADLGIMGDLGWRPTIGIREGLTGLISHQNQLS